jgi:WD40 repeat protein
MNLLKNRMSEAIRLANSHGARNPRNRIRLLPRKFALAHELFTAMDIHVFPNFVAAHKDAIKSAEYSAFDSHLWLTGGYDCIIRIHDIRATNNHICLTQLVGHKSIVTDAHFTKNDSHIVSSSFDRTLKIWNSQSASCEKTLLGHTDSVMSCAISPDNRHIISGSMDNTIRVWEMATGQCIATIKKHTRWVKIVRFSPDGKYFASAGLDHRIYIWETKFIVNARVAAHKK